MSSISSSTAALNQHHLGRVHGPSPEKFKQAFKDAAQAAGVDPSKVDDLQKQVDDAVKSLGTRDRAKVGAAIDAVLQRNGVDPTKFHEAMKAQFEKARQTSNGQAPPPPPQDGDADDAPAGAVAPSGLDVAA